MTWTFTSLLGSITVSAPTWWLARERARREFGNCALAWRETGAKADVILEWRGNAAGRINTLELVEVTR